MLDLVVWLFLTKSCINDLKTSAAGTLFLWQRVMNCLRSSVSTLMRIPTSFMASSTQVGVANCVSTV